MLAVPDTVVAKFCERSSCTLSAGELSETSRPSPTATAPFTTAVTFRPSSRWVAVPPWASRVSKSAPPGPTLVTETNSSEP